MNFPYLYHFANHHHCIDHSACTYFPPNFLNFTQFHRIFEAKFHRIFGISRISAKFPQLPRIISLELQLMLRSHESDQFHHISWFPEAIYLCEMIFQRSSALKQDFSHAWENNLLCKRYWQIQFLFKFTGMIFFCFYMRGTLISCFVRLIR